MNKSYITALLTISALAFTEQTIASGMTQKEYKAAQKIILADSKQAQKNCDTLSDQAKSLCLTDAKKSERIAIKKLNSRHRKKLDDKMTTSNTDQESHQRHSTPTVDRLRRP